MRNYCTAYFTRVSGWDDPYPTNYVAYWSIGLDQNAAHVLAVGSLLPIVSSLAHTDVFDEGIRYLLLNRETIVGVFTSVVGGGTIAFNAFGNVATAEGLPVGKSPRDTSFWPSSDGKSNKTATQLANVATPALFDLVSTLQTLAAKLLKSKILNNQRIGSIILSQLAQVFAGQKTLNQALVVIDDVLDQIQ